jgi:hypothetical protein
MAESFADSSSPSAFETTRLSSRSHFIPTNRD